MRFAVIGLLLAAGAVGAQEPEGYLGIAFTCPLKRIEDASGVRVIHLAYPAVESVEPGSPASLAGISAGVTNSASAPSPSETSVSAVVG